MADPRQVIEQHIEAFNTRDAASDPWAAEAEMVAPGTTIGGREGIVGFLAIFQNAFPDGRLAIQRLLVDGSSAAAEGTFTGTHDGVFQTPDIVVAPTGRPVEFRWAAAYELSGDEIASEHLYFDQLNFLGQLGLLPT